MNQECCLSSEVSSNINDGKYFWFYFIVDLHCRVCDSFHFGSLEKKKTNTKSITGLIRFILTFTGYMKVIYKYVKISSPLCPTCGCFARENSSPHLLLALETIRVKHTVPSSLHPKSVKPKFCLKLLHRLHMVFI